MTQLILLLDDDLFFPARVEPLLRAAGFSVSVLDSLPDLDSFPEPPAALLVNMGSHADERATCIQQWKESPVTRGMPVLAYCGHVEIELQRKARAAGADQVVANSALVERAGEIVKRLISSE